MSTLAQLHALLAEQQQAIRPQIDARIAELLEEADKLRGQIRDIDSIIKLIEPRTDGLNLDLAIAALEAFTRPKTLLTRFEKEAERQMLERLLRLCEPMECPECGKEIEE